MNLLFIKLGAVAALVAALIAGYLGWAKHERNLGRTEATAEYNIAIDKQKTEARTVLAEATTRADAATKALQTAKDQQENQDVKNSKVISDLTSKLRAARVLRDPGATGCGGSGSGSVSSVATSPSTGSTDAPQTSGVLSTAATDFLLGQTLEADGINAAYISCRASLLRQPGL